MLDCLRIKISQYCFIVIITLISYWDNTVNNIKHNNLWICVGLLFVGRSMCHNSLNTKNFNFSYVSLTWESHNMTTSTVSMSFRCFFIIFDHANSCASMRLAGEIHKIFLPFQMVLDLLACHFKLKPNQREVSYDSIFKVMAPFFI